MTVTITSHENHGNGFDDIESECPHDNHRFTGTANGTPFMVWLVGNTMTIVDSDLPDSAAQPIEAAIESYCEKNGINP